MANFMEADTGRLMEIAGRLDPAPAKAALEAAGEAKAAALVCGDPMPGCQTFSEAVGRVTDELIAFLTDASAGVPAYASVVRQGAGLYREANSAAEGFMREVHDGRA
jgi:hypothetical protein